MLPGARVVSATRRSVGGRSADRRDATCLVRQQAAQVAPGAISAAWLLTAPATEGAVVGAQTGAGSTPCRTPAARLPSAGLRTYGELVDRARSGPALRVWFRSEVRRRWASLLLLGVMAGLAVGLVTAAVSGAQRSASAYPRMRQQLKAADAVFFPSQIGIGDADVTKLGSIPEVAAWSGFALGPGGFSELGPDAGPFIPVGDGW